MKMRSISSILVICTLAMWLCGTAAASSADPASFADRLVLYLFQNGRTLSPSYKQVDCSTLMTKVLGRYYKVGVNDQRQINIAFTSEEDKKDFWQYFKHKSNCAQGGTYNCQSEEVFLTPFNRKRYPQDEACMCPPDNAAYIAEQEKRLSGVAGFIEGRGGKRIASITEAQKGDFIQFWYPNSWGHCGVVQSVDTVKQSMTLHSSFPSTDGYGIQNFRYNENTIIYIARINTTGK